MSYAVVHKPAWEIAYLPDLDKIGLSVFDREPDDPNDREPVIKALLPRADALRLGTYLLEAVAKMDRRQA